MLPCVCVLMTSLTVTLWWSVLQRKVSHAFFLVVVVIAPFIAPQKANAERTLIVLRASLAKKANA